MSGFDPRAVSPMDHKNYQDAFDHSPPRSRWNPKYWSWKQWAITTIAISVVIVAIVVPLEVTKMNYYPAYPALSYSLTDTYSGVNFFNLFDYGNGTEATNGFTNYVTREGAAWSNLTYASPEQAILRVLSQDVTGPAGRPTVKILSKQRYTKGLFIFDIEHVPYGCGTWPAIWMSDPDPNIWPANGEIDIVEAVNQGSKGVQMALHTTDGCQMKVKRKQTGKVLSQDCLNSTNYNQGCAVTGAPATYGRELNDNGGGVYAMEWRTAGIRLWFFPRGYIPADIKTGKPDPSTWNEALADFPSTKCDIDSHFKNHRIIINISLCGDWAGTDSIYKTEYGCPSTCADFVGGNPDAFKEAYWGIKSIKVYSGSA